MYKIIYQNMIIDVMNKIKYCKYIKLANRTLLCDKTSANCIVSSDGSQVYHIKGTLEVPTNYKSVDIVEIDKEEYDYLTSLVVQENPILNNKTEVEYWANIPYEEAVDMKIREKYSISQEFAILRQKDEKPEEYAAYYNYCEQCKNYIKSIKNI